MQRSAVRRRVIARAALVVVALFAAAAAFARVGGGESYSGGGGSGSGGSGGGSGGGELIYLVFRLLLWLTIEHPVIGIPVDIIVIIAVLRWMKSNNDVTVTTISSASPYRAPAGPQSLDGLRKFDPNFSRITFEDFCYSLYGRVHEARGAGDLDRYAPYLSEPARNALRSRAGGLRAVRGVVIGAFQVRGVSGLDTPTVSVSVSYESNYTEVTGAGEQSWYVRETWMLERRRDILSQPPEKSKADHCPRCGAALQTRTDGACGYCGVKITNGTFEWYVRGIQLAAREARGPLLTSNVPERGTESLTIYQAHFADARTKFESEHPGFAWKSFDARVREIAIELQNAWTARDWERVRPLETDALFQMHRYWIDAYLRQGLRNIVADYVIGRVEPVKIETDAYFEAITVRMWAQGRDHTVNERGQVVAGSSSATRRWTEYWTLIRTRAAGAGTKQACPNCGAAVAVGATGICDYCGGKLTAGSFDWVLSRIEQDESYQG